MPGAAATHVFVSGFGCVSASVSDSGAVDAGRLPEAPLDTPETTHTENRLFKAIRKRRFDRMIVDEMNIVAVRHLSLLHLLIDVQRPNIDDRDAVRRLLHLR